ncbi:MAG: PKD domain-containing protein, partial [Saprospiraceae bacterium]|nr:PKD domain-containing protein [Saprospiraceae bacterium]
HWDFGDGNSSTTTNPQHLYPIPGNHDVTLVVKDINNCVAEETKTIQYFPVPPVLIIEPSTFNGCAPAEIFFNNLSVPIDSTYEIVWDFGDGEQGFEISPTHRYETEGLYTIRIEVTSPIGCFTSATFPDWIRVRPSPQAGFDYSPGQPSNFEPTVSFIDQSIDAVAWQWRFSDDAAAFIQNPTHTFQDTGIKAVEQVVFHPNGCTDTAYALIDIEPQVRYFLPNAFTPNNDSRNDGYRGAGVLEGVEDFELTIWSRWGELLFETNDPTEAWNGRLRNTGEQLPAGVYLAQVTFTGPRNVPFRLREFATLIR